MPAAFVAGILHYGVDAGGVQEATDASEGGGSVQEWHRGDAQLRWVCAGPPLWTFGPHRGGLVRRGREEGPGVYPHPAGARADVSAVWWGLHGDGWADCRAILRKGENRSTEKWGKCWRVGFFLTRIAGNWHELLRAHRSRGWTQMFRLRISRWAQGYLTRNSWKILIKQLICKSQELHFGAFLISRCSSLGLMFGYKCFFAYLCSVIPQYFCYETIEM